MTKYTIAQILTAWEAAFGEDMMTEYPGFIQRLTEEESEKKWEKDDQKNCCAIWGVGTGFIVVWRGYMKDGRCD